MGGEAVGICLYSIVIHIWRFESYCRRCVVVAEFCFIKRDKVCVYHIRVDAGRVGTDNAPGRKWMPDVGMGRIGIAVIAQCMPQPSRRGTKCPPQIIVAMQDKFGPDVVVSRDVRVIY